MGGTNLKKIILLIISSVLSLGLVTACSNPKETNTITNKKIISRQNSNLSKITLKGNMGRINNKSYIGKEVYLIDSPTKGDGVQSNMIVFLGINSNKLIGYGYVD